MESTSPKGMGKIHHCVVPRLSSPGKAVWEKKVVEGKVQVKVGRALHLHGTSGGQECDFE